MLRLGFEPEKVWRFSWKSLCPAIIIGLFSVYFFSESEFSKEAYEVIHSAFLTVVLMTLLIMGYAKVFSAVMAVSIIYANYLIVNGLRYAYGEDYMFSSGYNIWIALVLPTLFITNILFSKPEIKKYWSFFYIILFMETAVIERLQNQTIDADSYFFYKHIGMFNYPALNVSVFCLMALFVCNINKGKILNATALFSSFSLFLAIYYSDNLLAFSLFSLAAAVIVLVMSVYYLHYNYYKDEELGIANYKSYYRDAEKTYPLKYSICLIYIDEYLRLLKRFGAHKIVLLKKMFLNRLRELNKNILVYRYKNDSFILVFLQENATDSMAYAEDIRRGLAKSIFVFNENNHLQLTVSQCVSEKKRSDADANAVLLRAEESLQKACQFTRNITIKS